MSTQGIVTLTDPEGHVLVKAVAGCNGTNAEALAGAFRDLPADGRPKDLAGKAYSLAVEAHFGCEDCLVVQWDNGFVMSPASMEGWLDDPAVVARWRKCFAVPEFNPRWDLGIADHVRVVVLG